IQHSRQRLGLECVGYRADEITVAEDLEIEVVRCMGGPETKRVHGPAAVTDGRAIEWHPNQRGRPTNDRAQGPTPHLERAPQLHLNSVLGARDPPRLAMTQQV